MIISDGYDVTAIFSESYNISFANKDSDIYKNEAAAFKKLVSYDCLEKIILFI